MSGSLLISMGDHEKSGQYSQAPDKFHLFQDDVIQIIFSPAFIPDICKQDYFKKINVIQVLSVLFNTFFAKRSKIIVYFRNDKGR